MGLQSYEDGLLCKQGREDNDVVDVVVVDDGVGVFHLNALHTMPLVLKHHRQVADGLVLLSCPDEFRQGRACAADGIDYVYVTPAKDLSAFFLLFYLVNSVYRLARLSHCYCLF